MKTIEIMDRVSAQDVEQRNYLTKLEEGIDLISDEVCDAVNVKHVDGGALEKASYVRGITSVIQQRMG